MDPRSVNTLHAETAPNPFRTLALIPSHPAPFRARMGGRRAFEDDLKITMRLKCPLQQMRGGAMDPQVRQRFPALPSTPVPNPPANKFLTSIFTDFVCAALRGIFSCVSLLQAGVQAGALNKRIRKFPACVSTRLLCYDQPLTCPDGFLVMLHCSLESKRRAVTSTCFPNHSNEHGRVLCAPVVMVRAVKPTTRVVDPTRGTNGERTCIIQATKLPLVGQGATPSPQANKARYSEVRTRRVSKNSACSNAGTEMNRS